MACLKSCFLLTRYKMAVPPRLFSKQFLQVQVLPTAQQRMNSRWCLRGIQKNMTLLVLCRAEETDSSQQQPVDENYLVWVTASGSAELLRRIACLTCIPKSLLPSKVRPESRKRPTWEMRNRREMHLVLWQNLCSRNGNCREGFVLQQMSVFCQ